MNTPTHLLISATALCRPTANTAPRDERIKTRRRNASVLIGALVPDAVIYTMFLWERLIQGTAEDELWNKIYWQEPWATWVSAGNSFPIYTGILIAGLFARCRLLMLFGVSAIIHLAFDFPFHHDDAHAHFWPISDWRFVSPISYWNTDYYGGLISIIEGLLAIGLIFVLWRRFHGVVIRCLLVLALLSYMAVPVYFTVMLG